MKFKLIEYLCPPHPEALAVVAREGWQLVSMFAGPAVSGEMHNLGQPTGETHVFAYWQRPEGGDK